MRVCILSRSVRLYSTQRLVEASQRLGVSVGVVNPTSLLPVMVDGVAQLWDGRSRLATPEAVVPRVGARSSRASLTVVEHLQRMGARPVNPADALRLARDKVATAHALMGAGVPVPASAVVRDVRQLPLAVALVGGFPVVVKHPRGSHGVGVMLARDEHELLLQAQALLAGTDALLLQRFCHEARGRDVRALVVGGRVVAAMERRARRGEFRANVHQGASTRAVALPPTWKRVAVAAAGAVGLGVAGVDLLRGPRGPVVLEVNASPGLRGIEGATGVDVAQAIIRHALAGAASRAA